jgi:spore coat protein CotH
MDRDLFSRRRLLTRSATAMAAASFAGLTPFLHAADKPLLEERKSFFAKGKIPQLNIQIAKEDMESLRREPKKYVKVQIKEDGDKYDYTDAALHLKGAAGSFRSIDEKPGLSLNMNKFEEDQSFHGVDKFHLNNSVQDPTYISELLVGEMYRAAGVPASRGTHAIVTLNEKMRGLYFLKEGYDRTFLKTSFGSKNGNFYDGGFLRDLDQPLELNSTKGDVKDQKELKALVEAAREGDQAKRFEKLEKLLDLDRFISYLALQVATWDWDGYPMNRNNYRIYHDPNKDKVIFIPSGMDQMWGDPNGPILPGFQGFVARGLVETKEGRKRYFARMGSILSDVYKVPDLLKRLDELEAHVQPALKSVDRGAGNDYKNQVNRLRGAIPQRAKSLAEQLKKNKA